MVAEKSELALVATFPKEKIKAEPWSPLECLEEFLRDVRDGKVQPQNVMIFYVEADDNGRLRPHYWCQNVSNADQIAYGALIQHMGIEDWRQ